MEEVIYKNSLWNSEGVPRVSIITPVYNRRNVLPRALESVKNQNCRMFEHIIVDDASTDDLDSVVFPYLKQADFPVLYIKRAVRGGTCG